MKIVKKISVICLIFIIVISNMSFAIENTHFLSVNKDKISKDETLEINIDLDSIELEKFNINLSANFDICDLELTRDDIEIENISNFIEILVDKSKLQLNTLKLYYLIPEDFESNSIIVNASISLDDQILLQDFVTIEVIQKEEKEQEQKPEVLEETKPEINPNIPEMEQVKEENNNLKEIFENNAQMGNASQPNQEQKQNTQNMQQTSQVINLNNFTANMTSTNVTEKESATYNGSNNNYLESLSIEDVELNTSFNKENTNYFITTTKTSLNISAIAQDSNAKVIITGADNLNNTSKILITVEAQNGDIRYYRIFVVKES